MCRRRRTRDRSNLPRRSVPSTESSGVARAVGGLGAQKDRIAGIVTHRAHETVRPVHGTRQVTTPPAGQEHRISLTELTGQRRRVADCLHRGGVVAQRFGQRIEDAELIDPVQPILVAVHAHRDYLQRWLFGPAPNYLMGVLGTIVLLAALWMAFEAYLALRRPPLPLAEGAEAE